MSRPRACSFAAPVKRAAPRALSRLEQPLIPFRVRGLVRLAPHRTLLKRGSGISALPSLARARRPNNWRVSGTLVDDRGDEAERKRRAYLSSFFSCGSSGTITEEGAMMEVPCAGANSLAM